MKKQTPLEFIRQVKVELGHVNWPTHSQTFKLTLTVIFISLIVGLYIAGIDVVFTRLVQSIINH